jgi:hypothetical protein
VATSVYTMVTRQPIFLFLFIFYFSSVATFALKPEEAIASCSLTMVHIDRKMQ